jgi:hypothetical protein
VVSAPAEAALTEPTALPRPRRPRGLPRRVRQASLAPQLQNAVTTTFVADAVADASPPAPSPELIRDRMSAFQTGMNRGRLAGGARTEQEKIQ